MLGNSAIVHFNRFQYWWSPAANGTFVECAEDLSDLILQIKRLLHDPELAKRVVAKQEQAVKDGLFGIEHQLSAWLRLLPYFPPQADAARFLVS